MISLMWKWDYSHKILLINACSSCKFIIRSWESRSFSRTLHFKFAYNFLLYQFWYLPSNCFLSLMTNIKIGLTHCLITDEKLFFGWTHWQQTSDAFDFLNLSSWYDFRPIHSPRTRLDMWCPFPFIVPYYAADLKCLRCPLIDNSSMHSNQQSFCLPAS